MKNTRQEIFNSDLTLKTVLKTRPRETGRLNSKKKKNALSRPPAEVQKHTHTQTWFWQAAAAAVDLWMEEVRAHVCLLLFKQSRDSWRCRFKWTNTKGCLSWKERERGWLLNIFQPKTHASIISSIPPSSCLTTCITSHKAVVISKTFSNRWRWNGAFNVLVFSHTQRRSFLERLWASVWRPDLMDSLCHRQVLAARLSCSACQLPVWQNRFNPGPECSKWSMACLNHS